MSGNRTAFNSYIDEIATELSIAHAEANIQFEITSCIGNLDQLQRLTQQYPSRVSLYKTKQLLSIDSSLYIDLIQPALFKRLAHAD